VVLFVSMLAQPVKKITPQAAKMRIRLELIILVFMVRCVLTNLGLQVESTSIAGVNSIFRLSRNVRLLDSYDIRCVWLICIRRTARAFFHRL